MNGGTSILGQSISFPPRLGADGRFVWSSGEDNVRESIAVILKTEAGERVGQNEFGAGLGRFLFEPNNAATHARLAEAITKSLTRWEPRIVVEAVDVAVDPADREASQAAVTYRLVATGASERITLAVPLAAS